MQCQLNIFLDGDNCILCNACIEVCPTNVLHMADLDLVESVNGTPDEPRLNGGQELEARRCDDYGRVPVHPLRPVRPNLPNQLHHHAALRAEAGAGRIVGPVMYDEESGSQESEISA